MRWNRGAPCGLLENREAPTGGRERREDQVVDAADGGGVDTETWPLTGGRVGGAADVDDRRLLAARARPASATAPSLVSIAFAAVRLLRSRFWACRSWAGARPAAASGS